MISSKLIFYFRNAPDDRPGESEDQSSRLSALQGLLSIFYKGCKFDGLIAAKVFWANSKYVSKT